MGAGERRKVGSGTEEMDQKKEQFSALRRPIRGSMRSLVSFWYDEDNRQHSAIGSEDRRDKSQLIGGTISACAPGGREILRGISAPCGVYCVADQWLQGVSRANKAVRVKNCQIVSSTKPFASQVISSLIPPKVRYRELDPTRNLINVITEEYGNIE
jgi:hypothetical protein